ncbi:MAG: hypothetical protein AB8I08_39765 [Sandaracinaceae bacterium]
MDDEIEGRFRTNLRPWFFAAAANVLFAVVLLGIPYSRGPRRAEETLPRFTAFAACFYDGQAATPPGLGLPRGERARYASLVLSGDAEWPGRCRPLLRAIPPEESPFLFPAVKSAEVQLRATVEQLDRELGRLQGRDDDHRVSDRTLRAMSLVRAALAELGVSAGVAALSAEHDAITLGEREDLPTPSIIPMRISIGGPWHVRVSAGALVASAMDSRSVAHARVEDGGVDLRLTRRPRLVGGLLGAQEPPWLIWSTAAEQCEPDCTQRASGLAALVEDRQTLEPMMWLQAHPALEPAASMHVEGQTAWVLAAASLGAEVRRFTLPVPEVRQLGQEAHVPQIQADATWLLPGAVPRRGAFLMGTPPSVAVVGADGLRLVRLTPETVPTPLGQLEGTARLATCGGTGDGWLVYASEHGMVVARSGAEDAVIAELALPVRPPDPGSVAVVCEGEGARVFALSDGVLHGLRCTSEGCEDESPLGRSVAAFDAVRHGDATLVAWTRDADEGAVQVTSVTGEQTTHVPAACWTDPQDGPCGAPRLASDGETVMLVTRDESDFRVLRSADGRTWDSLEGLGQP